MARPKPWAPPVTTAQRPFRSILFMVTSPLSFVIPGCAARRRPESILPVVVMDSGLALRAPRNDGVIVDGRARSNRGLQRPAAIDEMRDAGRERAFVAGKIDRKRRDFLGRAEPSHRLPAHEHVAASRTRGGR